MRALALFFMISAVSAQAAYSDWTSREAVLRASQAFGQKLTTLQTDLVKANPSANLVDQWRAVQQQTDAMNALVTTNAAYDEVLTQFRSLGTALGEARRLMYLEGLCYHKDVSSSYQAVRLAFRRLDRNMQGLPAEE